MLLSKQKREENIAEYVLYMWQIEDMIRSVDFDLEAIVNAVILPSTDDENLRAEWIEWYRDIIRQMKTQSVLKKGHIQPVQEVIMELFFLHNSLLNIHNDEKYKAIFERAIENIREFQRLSNNSKYNEIETCFNAMYAKLLLRLQNRTISPETEAAMDTFRDVLAYLSKAYKQGQSGNFKYNFN